MEQIFHDGSYGYRTGRSALDAVEACRQNCWRKDWAIKLDIQDFFGSCRIGGIARARPGTRSMPSPPHLNRPPPACNQMEGTWSVEPGAKAYPLYVSTRWPTGVGSMCP
jgi:hypothetical protein